MLGGSGVGSVSCRGNLTKTCALAPRPRNMLQFLLTSNWKYPALCAFVGLLYHYRRRFRGWMSFFTPCCWRAPVESEMGRNSPQSHGYLGLQNEGSTCYLNSILQCLFMTPEFTNNILSEDGGRVDTVGAVMELQKLFINLQYGNSPPSTKTLMARLGIQSGKQQDLEEHFRLLLNNIPEQMKAHKLFHIQMVHSITCNGCGTHDTFQNTWLSLPVSIQNENLSVMGAVNNFLNGYQLEGDNRLYCNKCNCKQVAISRNYFESLPKVLVIYLKRYEINSGHFRKIYTSVSVDNSLKIKLEKQDASAEYELFALCHHYGGLTSGHYTSEIKSFDDNKWYIFNDSRVMGLLRGETENSETAYLLMYHEKQNEKPRFLEKEQLPKEIQGQIDSLTKRSGSKSRKQIV